MSVLCIFLNCLFIVIRRRDVVGRVPAFQPGGPGSIPGGVRNFNFCPGIGCVSFLCVLSCVVFSGGPDIVLTTHSGRSALVYLSSVLVQRLLLPYRHLTHEGRNLQWGQLMTEKEREWAVITMCRLYSTKSCLWYDYEFKLY